MTKKNNAGLFLGPKAKQACIKNILAYGHINL